MCSVCNAHSDWTKNCNVFYDTSYLFLIFIIPTFNGKGQWLITEHNIVIVIARFIFMSVFIRYLSWILIECLVISNKYSYIPKSKMNSFILLQKTKKYYDCMTKNSRIVEKKNYLFLTYNILNNSNLWFYEHFFEKLYQKMVNNIYNSFL